MLIENIIFNDVGFLHNQKEYLVHQLDLYIIQINGTYQYHYFYTKYLVSFFRSAFVFLIVNHAVKVTLSWRLTGLMIFLLVSMALDMALVVGTFFIESSLVSDLIGGIRYHNQINFQSSYTFFEVMCIISVFINLARATTRNDASDTNFNNNDKYSPSWFLHSVFNQKN